MTALLGASVLDRVGKAVRTVLPVDDYATMPVSGHSATSGLERASLRSVVPDLLAALGAVRGKDHLSSGALRRLSACDYRLLGTFEAVTANTYMAWLHVSGTTHDGVPSGETCSGSRPTTVWRLTA